MFRRHKHTWINVAAKTGFERAWYDKFAKRCSMSQTMVLQRCACGASATEMLDGDWTPAELGVNDRTVGDLMRLLNETVDSGD